MKLLVLTQYYPPETGAPQNRLHELALRLQAKGVSVTVLTALPNYPKMEVFPNYEGKAGMTEEIEGIKVHRASIFAKQSGGIINRLLNYFSFVWSSYRLGKKRFHQGEFDFLMVESPPLFLGFSAVYLARKLKAKLIFNVSDLWPESAEKLEIVTNKPLLNLAYKLEAWCYQNATLITGQTQGIVKDINHRFPKTNTYWLPNGVDLSYYNPDAVTSNWREKRGFSSDDILLFYGGIIGHAQGLEVILQAAKKVKAFSKLKFVLIGEGPEKEKLVTLKEKLALSNVTFLPAVPKTEMPKVVKAVDATIVPLRKLPLFEGAIPSKIFENLAMKNPVILGVQGEAKQLFIDEGNCGISFEPENVEELSSVLRQIAEGSVNLVTLGENGRKYVERKFNRDKISESFLTELKKLT